jgi:hypothetical protein
MLIRNRPAGIQLVPSSRLDPPVSLPRLRLAGRLWELRAERMRFSLAEVTTLLARSGLTLSVNTVKTRRQQPPDGRPLRPRARHARTQDVVGLSANHTPVLQRPGPMRSRLSCKVGPWCRRAKGTSMTFGVDLHVQRNVMVQRNVTTDEMVGLR